MDPDAIRAIVQEGQGLMRPILDVGSSDMTAILAYLSATNPFGRGGGGRGRGGRGAGPPLPPGPVVASGGAPQPPLPARGTGAYYPGVGGNAGNIPWPEGIDPRTLPATRYMSGYNVMGTATWPPYTTLTAYDLNTGEIKWQIAPGDHPPTVAAGGPRGTGGVGGRNGILVTRTGLVFHAAGDGKIRADDEDTGKELWASLEGGGPGGAGQETGPSSIETPRGYIALALPRR
jgi:quinoprotein glucose dehydrogenase